MGKFGAVTTKKLGNRPSKAPLVFYEKAEVPEKLTNPMSLRRGKNLVVYLAWTLGSKGVQGIISAPTASGSQPVFQLWPMLEPRT